VRYLLDTDICIFIARRKPARVIDRFDNLPPGDVGISVISYGELRFGAEKSDQPEDALKVLSEVLEGVRVVPLEDQVSAIYGNLRLYLERRGQQIGNNDLWIASHCLQLGLTLVTNNEREFRRIPNLAIENWTH
jgi:tRNA(fMet)-specific endonuclease VapC